MKAKKRAIIQIWDAETFDIFTIDHDQISFCGPTNSAFDIFYIYCI